ncbi:hypothetical protein PIB30_105602, partial [Stylosanthes scabra]|nr:hypothetical protein [Stylosanthes scabra]
KGSLQIKKWNLEAKQSKAPRTCVDEHAYACCSYPNPRLSHPLHLGVATCLIRATHMRRSPRICVDSHSVHVHGHVATTLNVTMTHLPTYRRTTPTHMRGRHIVSMSS